LSPIIFCENSRECALKEEELGKWDDETDKVEDSKNSTGIKKRELQKLFKKYERLSVELNEWKEKVGCQREKEEKREKERENKVQNEAEIPEFIKNPEFYLGNDWLYQHNKNSLCRSLGNGDDAVLSQTKWSKTGCLLSITEATGLLLLICKNEKTESAVKRWVSEEIGFKTDLQYLKSMMSIISWDITYPFNEGDSYDIYSLLHAQLNVAALQRILAPLLEPEENPFDPDFGVCSSIQELEALTVEHLKPEEEFLCEDLSKEDTYTKNLLRTAFAIFPKYEKALEKFWLK